MQSTIDTRDVSKCQCGEELIFYGVLRCDQCLVAFQEEFGLCECSMYGTCEACLDENCYCDITVGACNYCQAYPYAGQTAASSNCIISEVISLHYNPSGDHHFIYDYKLMNSNRKRQLEPSLSNPYYARIYHKRKNEEYPFFTIESNPIYHKYNPKPAPKDNRSFVNCTTCTRMARVYGYNQCIHCLLSKGSLNYCSCLNKPTRCLFCLHHLCHCYKYSTRCEFCLTFPDCIPTAAQASCEDYIREKVITIQLNNRRRVPNCSIHPSNIFMEYTCDYKGMKESKQVLHEAIFKELFKPSRIEAWINQGNDPLDYLP